MGQVIQAAERFENRYKITNQIRSSAAFSVKQAKTSLSVAAAQYYAVGDKQRGDCYAEMASIIRGLEKPI